MIEQSNEKASCPYNPNHTFAREKLVWHLSRCKDGIKNQHLFAKCKYNGFHIIAKTQLAAHESVCVDKKNHERLVKSLQFALIKPEADSSSESIRSRSRSLEKIEHSHESPQHSRPPSKQPLCLELLQNCQDCQRRLLLFKQTNTDKNHEILRMLSKYQNL